MLLYRARDVGEASAESCDPVTQVLDDITTQSQLYIQLCLERNQEPDVQASGQVTICGSYTDLINALSF